MQILEANKVTDQLIEALERLLPQLTQSSILTRDAITEIVASPNIILITVSEKDIIVGMLTLVLYRTPSSLKARIEDVVVDESSRGKGVGKKMMNYAIDIAAQKKADGIDLTSRPQRKTANRLYDELGFEKYETNVYRRVLK